jgi:proteic killer suppression protein
VKIRNFAHKGLKRLYEQDSAKGVPADTADKLRKMFAYLDSMESVEELRALTFWSAHTLTGSLTLKGTGALALHATAG